MEPRPAATVIVARPAAGVGIEVLALRRSAASRFAPGFLVFPGGVVEPGDAELAARLFGDAGEAPRACALRELHEETGLLLAPGGLRAVPEAGALGSLPSADAGSIPLIARWVAPEMLEVRFDAHFFAAASPRGVEPVADGVEVDWAWWARPIELLDASTRGDALLMWPTLVTLQALAACATVGDVLGLEIPQVHPGDPASQAGVPQGAWRRP